MTATARRAIPAAQNTVSAARVTEVLRVALFWLPVALVLSGVVLVHLFNMGNYPYFENDEGTYVSQGWAVLTEGRLAPYTYWYDHAPAGWLQIAVWGFLTGGFYTFGSSIESGRVLMLVFQLLSALLIYRIARSVSGSSAIGLFAVAIFGFSALGIYLHRRVLLDNITAFWMLLSIALLVDRRPTLVRVWLSAIALGVSILSKELTVFLVPAMAFLVWVRTHHSQRWLAMIGWISIVGALVSMYVLMAVLKGELFPTGTFLGGDNPHVSLLGSLEFQTSRGRDGGLFEAGSGFWKAMSGWAQAEPLLIVGGSIASAASVLWLRARPEIAALGMLALSLWLFMGRGGIVIGFYVIPVLPLLALNVALMMWVATAWLGSERGRLALPRRITVAMVRGAAMAVALAVVATGYFSPYLGFASNPLQLWQTDEASAQRAAVSWIRTHVSPSSSVVIDNYAWLDLRAPADGPAHDLAHYYWKVGADPEITLGAFDGDWHNADYIMVTPQVTGDAGDPALTLVDRILEHSTRIRSFDGWPVSIRRVNDVQHLATTADAMVGSLWESARTSAARVGSVATAASEQTLVQAVYMNDRTAFEAIRSGMSAPTTERRADRAFALLLAGKRWDDAQLTAAGSALLDDVWSQTTMVGRHRVATISQGDGAATVSLGSLAPEQYRVFADADPEHDWGRLIDSSYWLLTEALDRPEFKGQAGTLPDRVVVDRSTGAVIDWADESTARGMVGLWHLTLDWLWWGEERARVALDSVDVPRQAFMAQGRVVDRYGLDGAPHTDREAIGIYASVLGTFLAGPDPEIAHEILGQKILEPVLADGSGASATDRMWAWNATALLDGGLANVWMDQSVVDWPDDLMDAGGSAPAS